MTIYVNDEEMVFKRYPNGELIVPKIKPAARSVFAVDVRLHWTGDHDLLHLALVRSALETFMADYHLTIDYMPYSRMDRDQGDMAFTLQTVCQQIRAMGWKKIYVIEPHSHVTLDLLHAEPIWSTMKLLRKTMEWIHFDRNYDWIVFPDKGALNRYSKQDPLLGDLDIIVLQKTRDFETGKITGLEVAERIIRGMPHELEDKPGQALIVDDLSSRGGTFIAAADLVREHCDINYVALLVTHMEPVGLTGELRHKLNRVFCTDTMDFPRPIPDNFHVFQRRDYL